MKKRISFKQCDLAEIWYRKIDDREMGRNDIKCYFHQ